MSSNAAALVLGGKHQNSESLVFFLIFHFVFSFAYVLFSHCYKTLHTSLFDSAAIRQPSVLLCLLPGRHIDVPMFVYLVITLESEVSFSV